MALPIFHHDVTYLYLLFIQYSSQCVSFVSPVTVFNTYANQTDQLATIRIEMEKQHKGIFYRL